MKRSIVPLIQLLLLPALTIVVIVFGTYFTNSALSQGTSPPLKIGNRTTAFEVVKVERSVRRVRLTLKNNYNKTITAYATSAGSHSHNLHELADEEAMKPGGARDQYINLPAGRNENDITVLAVVFDDKTGDGDGTAIKEINDYRLGKKIQYRRIVRLLDNLLVADSNQFPTVLRGVKAAINNLPTDSDQASSHFVVAGLRDAKASILIQLENLEQVRLTEGTNVVRERITKARERLNTN